MKRPQKKDIEELLHQCLDPYVPPIISDTGQSFKIIADTIHKVYTRALPSEEEIQKIMDGLATWQRAGAIHKRITE